MGAGSFFTGRAARALLSFSNFMVFASSAILVGIISYYIRWGYRGVHWVYPLVIAVITLFIYLITLFLPILKSYRGYMLPLNFILTYLWVTALIFAAQRFAGGRCRFTAVRCGLQHTILAFWIIGFVFLLHNVVVEALMWAHHWKRGPRRVTDAEKHQPLSTGSEPVPTSSTAAPVVA
ncbi:hypothetical protein VTJ04DRAFT_10453 [Mycothermus thermophilus]|uniref:uncharacterized protein n=1 Tax=Humicola insolens TaxID=85995 RepID=UPI0037429659